AQPDIARRGPALRKTRRSGNNSSPTDWKKRRTIKCLRHVEKNSNRKAELLESNHGRSDRRNDGRANAPARKCIVRSTLARAFSTNPGFHDAAVRRIGAGRLRRPIDARCKPDEMASRPHHVVFRNMRTEKVHTALP